jgi:Protein of unknown function (DUF2934)
VTKLNDENSLRAGLPESIYGNLDEIQPTSSSKGSSGVSRIDREVVPSLSKTEKNSDDVTFATLGTKSSSDAADESRIRERAYELYVQGGYADGHADEHWYIASREIEQLYSGEKLESKPSKVEEPTFPSHAQTEQRPEKKVA